MEILKDRIRKDGKVLNGNILKVDNFVNHQVDVKLFNEMGKEFKKRFNGYEINKIVTIESSGIGIATIVSQYFDFAPVVFAKKTIGGNFSQESYETKVYSYTKKQEYNVKISKEFINKGDKVLIIDDFLANGNASLGLVDIIKQAEATVVGVGIIIEKGFQEGREKLEKEGIRVESLAIVEKMEGNKIYFK